MNIPGFPDKYSVRARLNPAVLAGASLVTAFFILIPWEPLAIPQLGSLLLSGALIYFLADLARRLGKRIEQSLFTGWGGKPSTVILRFSDRTFDAVAKGRYQAFLAGRLGEKDPPTARRERTRLDECDAFYDRCGNWLREQTRDAEKFPLIFNENVTYGFRRNLLGIKWIAVGIDVALIVLAAWVVLLVRPSDPPLTTKFVVVAAIAVIHAAVFLLAVTKASVRTAANQYGRQLILACETLAG